MKYMDFIFGIVEIIVGIIIFNKTQNAFILAMLCMYGGYNCGKGLYKEEI